MKAKVLFIFLLSCGLINNNLVAQPVLDYGNTEINNDAGVKKGYTISAGNHNNYFVVNPGGNIDLKAAIDVNLGPGFSALPGSEFIATADLRELDENNNFSRDFLQTYLSRAILINQTEDDNIWLDQLRMIQNIHPNFLGQMAWLWGAGWNDENRFSRAQQRAAQVHALDPYIICQAGVMEYIRPDMDIVDVDNDGIHDGPLGARQIPAYVLQAFGQPTGGVRYFRFINMIFPDNVPKYTFNPNIGYYERNASYDNPITNNTHNMGDGEIPDMNQIETQMWFYYRATRYIDCGYESVLLGQVNKIGANDALNTPAYNNYWNLVNLIKQYAKTKNRGFVILAGDTRGLYYGNTNQLLFDYHRHPHRPQELGYCRSFGNRNVELICLGDIDCVLGLCHSQNKCSYFNCPVEKAILQPAVIDVNDVAIYTQSAGGVTLSGYYVSSQDYLVDFDWYGVPHNPGYPDTDLSSIYGWDETSWFALNSLGETFRNEYLNYLVGTVKCFDSNGFLQMPGMAPISPGSGYSCPPEGVNALDNCNYYSNTGKFNQEETIKNIWNTYQMECESSNAPRMAINIDSTLSKIPAENDRDIISIYPNPTSGVLSFDFILSYEKNVKVSIINALGKEIYSSDIGKIEKSRFDLNLGSESEGVYVIKINYDNEMLYKKIVLTK